MKKLTPSDIENLVIDYYEGIKVAKLSKGYGVTEGTIYYHIKMQSSRRMIKNPTRYLEHVKNSILCIENKISAGVYTDQQLPHALSELARLKAWLKVDRSNLPTDAFVLQ